MSNGSMTKVVGFLLLASVVGCGDERGTTNEQSQVRIYGVGWVGNLKLDSQSTTEALVVEACLNEELCASRLVLIAGAASAERWEAHRPPEPPEGAPQGTTWDPPEAGSCRSVVEWIDDIGRSACATVQDENSSVELQFFLDLSVMQDEMQSGDVARLRVEDESDGSVLVERTDVVGAAAPYYRIFSL